jgi:hypothetical protein
MPYMTVSDCIVTRCFEPYKTYKALKIFWGHNFKVTDLSISSLFDIEINNNFFGFWM